MPEIQNAMLSSMKAVAEDNVGAAGEHGGEQDGVILGVVLEVGVLHQDEITRDLRHPGADRVALAVVFFMQQDANATSALTLDGGQKFARAVRRKIVNDDDLFFERNGDSGNRLDDVLDRVALIEDWNDDREFFGRAVVGGRQDIGLNLLSNASAIG